MKARWGREKVRIGQNVVTLPVAKDDAALSLTCPSPPSPPPSPWTRSQSPGSTPGTLGSSSPSAAGYCNPYSR